MPGGYANVHVDLVGGAGSLHIPVSALIFDQNGLRVATVGADDSVVFKTVTIARDLGREIELGSGMQAEDRVIAAPPGRHRRRRSGSAQRRQPETGRHGRRLGETAERRLSEAAPRQRERNRQSPLPVNGEKGRRASLSSHDAS